jgi:hypothetical protein
MRPLFTNRFQIPEVWFSAFLFSFKLFAVVVAALLLIWHVMLPPNNSNAQTGLDQAWFSASHDFAMVASGVSLLYFLAAGILVIGGLVQLFKYSRRAAIWSIAFGVLAFIIGLFLAFCVSDPDGYFSMFRRVG